jgi:protein-disulfide isomerase
VFKSFPSYQGPARKASAAAIAAFRQKKFWELHHALHEAEKPLADGKIEEIADSLKLDMAKFLKDLEDAGLQKIIDDDIKEGLEARVYSVPTFFINGKEIKNEKLNDIYAIIDSELERLTKAK